MRATEPTAPTIEPGPPAAGPSQVEAALLVDGLPGRLLLHYQPVVDLRSDAIVGAEALLRWWHPTYGMLRPGASLAGTRWDGRLDDIEKWALHAGAQQAAAWARSGQRVPIAVNISGRYLARPDLAELVADAVTAAAVEPDLLGVDVPLAALATSPASVRRSLRALGELGVQVVLDGVAGAFDPWLIRGARIDVVKVVLQTWSGRGTRFQPSVGAALASGAELRALCVAKAVETPAQLAGVRELGFDAAFGHAFGPALTPEAVASVLAGRGASDRMGSSPGGAADDETAGAVSA